MVRLFGLAGLNKFGEDEFKIREIKARKVFEGKRRKGKN